MVLLNKTQIHTEKKTTELFDAQLRKKRFIINLFRFMSLLNLPFQEIELRGFGNNY